MRVMSRAALALAATLVVAPALSAQTSFNLAAGLALPMGDFGEGSKMGYNVTAGLGLKPAMIPVGIRIEGMYNAFAADAAGVDFTTTIMALTANATVSSVTIVPMGYLIGGLGMYRADATGDDATGVEASSDLGFNIGAGLNIPLTGFGTYVEGRFHIVNTEGGSTTFFPLVFGVKF